MLHHDDDGLMSRPTLPLAGKHYVKQLRLQSRPLSFDVTQFSIPIFFGEI